MGVGLADRSLKNKKSLTAAELSGCHDGTVIDIDVLSCCGSSSPERHQSSNFGFLETACRVFPTGPLMLRQGRYPRPTGAIRHPSHLDYTSGLALDQGKASSIMQQPKNKDDDSISGLTCHHLTA
ncbi:unnamed protein product [Tetraodon nigroviridis]|uniref:(spotted green pufferfish) hypothetical protein n=1 Tax=Tetraodon nigroviridis TaxID=99883 RepID=Q4SBT9_TETNG|nr:unnamed protein product [Tetraodon nigroviridis]